MREIKTSDIHTSPGHKNGLSKPRLSLPRMKGTNCVEKRYRRIREEKEFPGFEAMLSWHFYSAVAKAGSTCIVWVNTHGLIGVIKSLHSSIFPFNQFLLCLKSHI